MGSLAISQTVSDQVYRPSTIFGGAVNSATSSSETAYRPMSHPVSQHSLRDPTSSRAAVTTTNDHPPHPSTTTTMSTVASIHPPHYPPSSDRPGYGYPPPRTVRQTTSPSAPTAPTATSSTSLGPDHLRMTSHLLPHGHGSHDLRPHYPPDPRQPHSRTAPGGDPTRFPLTRMPHSSSGSLPPSPRLQPTYASSRSLGGSDTPSLGRITVRDLSHIQSFASEEFFAQSHRSRRPGVAAHEVGRQYEISSMPVMDIIEMVAGLLTKIATTNDMQHEHVHRHIPPPDGAANLTPQASSVLAFHGKNVPSITILNYLSRIHKYCPTTYEVFLSLLVYFDRMTEMVNRRPLEQLRRCTDATVTTKQELSAPRQSSPSATPTASWLVSGRASMVTPPPSTRMAAEEPRSPSAPPSLQLDEEREPFSNFFVVDSFNIHRLVIAGVTCASKFFSDVFYTNSRYARVGGLPLVELNHLELQFLLLNDFRLSVPVEELEAYGTMLVEFYAREVVQQQQQQAAMAATAAAAALNASVSPRTPIESPGRRGTGGG